MSPNCLPTVATNLLRRNVIRQIAVMGRARQISAVNGALPSRFSGNPSSTLGPLFRQQYQQRTMVVITKSSPANEQPIQQNPMESAVVSMSQSPAADASAAPASDELLAITPSCIKQVHALLKRRNKSTDEMFLRVFVDAGGCSGFTYQFELDDDFAPDEDLVFAPPGSDGARVVVDEASLKLIQGSTIDYVQEMIKSAFVVAENPQSESACGCGSSFAIKNFASAPALD